MKRRSIFLFAMSLLAAALTVNQVQAADSAESQLQALQQQGAGPFDAQAGQELWQQQVNGRSCSQCHNADPDQPGTHQRTGKAIPPMSVRANPKRFTDAANTEKWFRRNCRWTLGRECSAQEKGDVIRWLSQP